MKMQSDLERKNLYYSVFLAVVLLLFLVGYFYLMIPSLYLNHMKERNLEAAIAQHQEYVQQQNFEQVHVSGPITGIGLRVPFSGNVFYIDNKNFSVQITMENETGRNLLEQIRQMVSQLDADTDSGETAQQEEQLKQEITKLIEEIRTSDSYKENEICSMEFFLADEEELGYHNEYIRYHRLKGDALLMECGIKNQENEYISYISLEKTQDTIFISILATMAPDMNEIRPVVLQSLPMLGAVILLLVLVFSLLYSKGMVSPMVSMSEKLHETIRQNNRELEAKNAQLEEENKRQEIFLRSSSHQLKTPISAALLLLDGMIHKVGKYRDTEVYLPKVKEELLSMRKMVEDILYLNHCAEELHMVPIDVHMLLDKELLKYKVKIEDKHLQIIWQQGKEQPVLADETVLYQILDNLISNAVQYTPTGGKIGLKLEGNDLWIRNFGANVPEKILPHIFEPFVSGNTGEKGHGLGLYIVSYFVKKLHAEITIENEPDAVCVHLQFAEESQKA